MATLRGREREASVSPGSTPNLSFHQTPKSLALLNSLAQCCVEPVSQTSLQVVGGIAEMISFAPEVLGTDSKPSKGSVDDRDGDLSSHAMVFDGKLRSFS